MPPVRATGEADGQREFGEENEGDLNLIRIREAGYEIPDATAPVCRENRRRFITQGSIVAVRHVTRVFQ